jgi:hypothetical protein
MDSMGNILKGNTIDNDSKYIKRFNNILTKINQQESTLYTLIYGVNNDDIVTDGLWFNLTPNTLITDYSNTISQILPKYENHYHMILIDRYNSYYYTKYYVNLKQHNFISKPHIHNVQLVLDFYVINYIYNYINEVHIKTNMKQIMSEYYQQLIQYRNKDYRTTTQHIKYFKTQIKYILIVLNSLLKKNNQKYLNHLIWINYIAPYLY